MHSPKWSGVLSFSILELPSGKTSPAISIKTLNRCQIRTRSYRSDQASAEPAGHPEGFTIDDFIVDHAGRTATCPNGLIRPISRAGWATFGAACATCPMQARCTRSRDDKTLRGSAPRRPATRGPGMPPATRNGWPNTRQHGRSTTNRRNAYRRRGDLHVDRKV
jgi:hypothetical protein